jgi:tetratricopeptide (TPR) repeat protein
MRLATACFHGAARLWDARPAPLSPPGELAYRLWSTRPEPKWHEAQFRLLQDSDRFAAAIHLECALAYDPAQRPALLRERTQLLDATLQHDPRNAAASLLLARTAWHSPTLGLLDSAALLPSADDKGQVAMRTRGGILLRLGRVAEAIAVLEAALKERASDQPPVEELLLAWAYDENKQADKAMELWTKAKAWLERTQQPVHAVHFAGTPPDQRGSVSNWETWYELDILWRELASRFEKKKT